MNALDAQCEITGILVHCRGVRGACEEMTNIPSPASLDAAGATTELVVGRRRVAVGRRASGGAPHRIIERGVAPGVGRGPAKGATVRILEGLPLRLSHCSSARQQKDQCNASHHAFSFLLGRFGTARALGCSHRTRNGSLI